MVFQPIQPRKLSEEIVDRFLDTIGRGIIQPGEALPPERELAQQFRVSRPPLREALKVLETMGVIRVEQRRRIVVQSIASLSLRDPLARAMQTNPRIAVQMLEVRAVLEGWAAQQAAQYASLSEIQRLENWMRKIEASMDHPHRAIESDVQFHMSLYRISKNVVLGHLMGVLMELLWGANQVERNLIYRSTEHRERIIQHHRSILEAIRRGDPKGARRAVEIHIAFARETLDRIH